MDWNSGSADLVGTTLAREEHDAFLYDGVGRNVEQPATVSPPRFVRVKPPKTNPVVYVIRCGRFVKIGRTVQINMRLSGMMTDNPHDLEIVATFPGGRDLEAYLHAEFSAHWHRGEWFREEGDLAAWVVDGCPMESVLMDAASLGAGA